MVKSSSQESNVFKLPFFSLSNKKILRLLLKGHKCKGIINSTVSDPDSFNPYTVQNLNFGSGYRKIVNPDPGTYFLNSFFSKTPVFRGSGVKIADTDPTTTVNDRIGIRNIEKGEAIATMVMLTQARFHLCRHPENNKTNRIILKSQKLKWVYRNALN